MPKTLNLALRIPLLTSNWDKRHLFKRRGCLPIVITLPSKTWIFDSCCSKTTSPLCVAMPLLDLCCHYPKSEKHWGGKTLKRKHYLWSKRLKRVSRTQLPLTIHFCFLVILIYGRTALSLQTLAKTCINTCTRLFCNLVITLRFSNPYRDLMYWSHHVPSEGSGWELKPRK